MKSKRRETKGNWKTKSGNAINWKGQSAQLTDILRKDVKCGLCTKLDLFSLMYKLKQQVSSPTSKTLSCLFYR